MTVITAMKFNPSHGALVADEQVSDGNRKVNISEKIVSGSFEGWMSYAVGFSGLCSLSNEVELVVPQILAEEFQNKERSLTARQGVNLFANASLSIRRSYIDNYLYTHYGLTEEQFQRGKKTNNDESDIFSISSRIMDHYIWLIGDDGKLSREFPLTFVGLIEAEEEKGIRLYDFSTLDSGTLSPAAFPYATEGSGSDVADLELADFLENMPRSKRKDIDPFEGLAALLRATSRAVRRNMGVGGVPSIHILKEGKLLVPEDNVSQLAMHIARGTMERYLPKKFEREALESLLYSGEDWKAIDHEMYKTAKDKDGLRRLLSGYKKD